MGATAREAPSGVAVLALDGATEDAWPLAGAVYGDSGLRPAGIDDPRARVLAGEPPPEGATSRLRELSELRAAVHGDDAPSRRILGAIADEVGAAAVLVVARSGGVVSARLYVVRSGAIEPEVLTPSIAPQGRADWSTTVEKTRVKIGARPAAGAPSAAPREAEKTPPKSSSVLGSPWLWGALGAAAVAGVTAYLLTRRSTDASSTYELHGRVQR